MSSSPSESESVQSEEPASSNALDASIEDKSEENELRITLREKLRALPLHKLETVKENGIEGIPLYRVVGFPSAKYVDLWLSGADMSSIGELDTSKDEKIKLNVPKFKKKVKLNKRTNKNAPVEVSSKQRVSRHRQVVSGKKKEARDPRFGPLSGTFNDEAFSKRYEFLEDIREKEIRGLRKTLSKDERIRKSAKDKDGQESSEKALKYEDRMKIQRQLTHLEQDRATKKRERIIRKVHRKVNKEEKEKVAKGVKRPFFLKKKDIKELEDKAKASEKKSKQNKRMKYRKN